jgi:hypothetical protein
MAATGVRVVPPAVARRGSFIAKGAILMPSYVNIGAYVDEGTMVDTWATVGSCAQVGKNVHLSGGVGLGGVLEPLQANPTIIEDNCFIGARSEVVEGVIVEENSVISAWACTSARAPPSTTAPPAKSPTAACPAGSVVVSGSLPKDGGKYSMYARHHRQARGCQDPRQDQPERPAARLIPVDARSAPEPRTTKGQPHEHDGTHPAPDGREKGLGRVPVGQCAGLIKINGECVPINNQMLPPDGPARTCWPSGAARPHRGAGGNRRAQHGCALTGVGAFASAPCASAAATRW